MATKTGRRATGKNDEPGHPLRIAIKFNDRAPKSPQDSGVLERLLERVGQPRGALRLLPLIESVKPERLDKLMDQARRNDPDYKPADFSAWYQIVCSPEVNVDEMARALHKLEEVETAYVMRPGPPPVSPADDPRNANQGYLNAAPNGIDARYAWGFTGGDGAGIGYVDLEQGWNLNHDDLAAAGITLISGVNSFYFFHGTSVLGEISMVDNTIGGVGAAPAATARVISQWRTAASYNTADAILDAAANMVFGDVLLLEAQEYDPNPGGLYFWPVEIADATYEAIRLTTALGIVVVEAACNGAYALDPYTSPSGKRIFDRTSMDFRDSGAIMVGAGSSASPHTRLGFSNHGNRVDCYAWGENIDTTTTDGAGTDNTSYTSFFNGTSGASPIIVGAALIVQGIAQASLGYRFSPRELREILKTDGTPSATPATDGIGVMPDLHAIITNDRINLAPDLYLRDYVGDFGNPTSGTVSQSPDIIVRQDAVAAPQTAFGTGSGTENNPSLSEDVETGDDNFVYVRVLNRGGSTATGASVDVYWSPPSTLVTPNLWHLIGTAMLDPVPTGNVFEVSDAILWPSADIPGLGHYCFIAVAGNAQDPKPDPTTFSSFDQYLTYVRNNNNVAWRNFDVINPPPSGFSEMDFIVPGAFDTSRRFELEAIGRLPEGSRGFLEVPAWLADSLRPHPYEVKHDAKREITRIPLHPSGVQPLGSVVLHARSIAKCRLSISIPKQKDGYHYDFAIRQLYKGAEVGRLTWRFAAKENEKREKDKKDDKQQPQQQYLKAKKTRSR